MKRLVEILNFNSDASCLPAKRWINCIKGGKNSLFCQWLQAYVTLEKKIVLGITGATVADLSILNPQAIELINAHPDIFQLILRPFSHDIGLLRSPKGFEINFQLGRKTIESEFSNTIPFFLPPEFMLTGEQIMCLEKFNVSATFINPLRFTKDIQDRIPQVPYMIKGVFDSQLLCIPCDGKFTDSYLESLFRFDASQWNDTLLGYNSDIAFSWRDGESPFFIPQGLQRERRWLQGEDRQITRNFLSEDGLMQSRSIEQQNNGYHASYPVHSFSMWMKEFRMLGYVQRIQELEKKIEQFSTPELAIWLQTINSDVLSAVEKSSPVVQLHKSELDHKPRKHLIKRSERGFEGEDYLALLEGVLTKDKSDHLLISNSIHIEKLRTRIKYLEKL